MMRTLFCCLMSVVFTLIVFAPAAHGAVFDVTDVTALRNALLTAQNNGQADTINIATGTYNITSVLTHAGIASELFSLQIVGAGAATTILDGGNSNRILNVIGMGDFSLSGVTIRNGLAAPFDPPGTGLSAQVVNTENVTVSDCIFENNAGGPGGGGALLAGGTATVQNSTFSGNSPSISAGGDGGGLFTNADETVIVNSTFINNGHSNTGSGGGVLISRGIASVTDSLFDGNMTAADGIGAGLDFFSITGGIALTGNTFDSNTMGASCAVTDGSGAAARIQSAGPLVVSGNLFSNNSMPCPGFGGGLRVKQSSPDDVLVSNNIFYKNTSANGSTWGVILIYTVSGTINFVNNTLSGNDSGFDSIPDIGFLLTADSAELNLYNNNFWGETGKDVVYVNNNDDLFGQHSPVNIFNNNLDLVAMTVTPGGNVLAGNNVNVDPLFVDQAGGDLHLTDSSPLINMGLNTAPGLPLTDIDGDDRILSGTADIGADEVAPQVATFTPSTGTLHIPELQFGGAQARAAAAATKAFDLEFALVQGMKYSFELKDYSKLTATNNPAATYDPGTGIVDIPIVMITGRSASFHVLLQKRTGELIFDLTGGGKN